MSSKNTDTRDLLSEKTRMKIMAHLAAMEESIDFNTLLSNLELSKGNLSVHISKLEKAGLVEVEKSFVGKKTKTTYQCTREGRRAMVDYLNYLEELLKPIKEIK